MASNKLKRTLGLWQLTLIGVGIILGAGIYVLIGEAAGLAGNALWLSFLFASIAACITGMSYAKLAGKYPRSGAEHIYVHKIFGNRWAWLIGWFVILNGIISAAAVAIGFSRYFNAVFGFPLLEGAITVIMLLSIILFLGVKESATITILFTIIETFGLVIIIFIGIPAFGNVDYTEMAKGLAGIFQASALIFFAFTGFETIARLSDETKNPKKTVPKAIILSIAISTIIYILVGISAISLLGWQSLSESNAPMASVASVIFGGKAFIALAFIALFSTSNTVLALMLTTSRLIYGMADYKTLPSILAKVTKKRKIPIFSIAITVLATIFFALMGNLETVASLANMMIFATFIAVNGCVIKINRKLGIKSVLLPSIGIVICIFMLFNLGFDILVMGAAFCIVGATAYELRNNWKIKK